MITKFKIFEDLQPKIEAGNYVLMNSVSMYDSVRKFINNNIGQIIELGPDSIRVKYDNMPKNIMNIHLRAIGQPTWNREPNGDFSSVRISTIKIFDIDQVVEFAKTKEELELKLAAKKYNL